MFSGEFSFINLSNLSNSFDKSTLTIGINKEELIDDSDSLQGELSFAPNDFLIGTYPVSDIRF